MNILFFTESGLGIGALVTDQICELKKQLPGTFGVVSTKEQEPGLVDRMKEADIPLLTLDGLESHLNFQQHIKLLRKYVVDHHIDIIHVQTNWELVMSYIVRLSLLFNHKLRLIYTIHAFRNNSHIKKYFALAIINIMLLLLADKVICTCNYTKNLFKMVGYKLVLIPLGIDSRFFLPEWRYVENAGVSIMFPAQFRKGKQQELIIRGFAGYVDKTGDKKSRLLLPGEGPLRGQMEELAEELGIKDQLFTPGHCSKEKIGMMFSTVNIAVISSNSETFGQCIVEPYVMGKVIVSTAVGIAPDLIEQGDCGFLFNTPEELTSILCYLSENEVTIKRMGKHNYANRMTFSWKIVTKQYLKAIQFENVI